MFSPKSRWLLPNYFLHCAQSDPYKWKSNHDFLEFGFQFFLIIKSPQLLSQSSSSSQSPLQGQWTSGSCYNAPYSLDSPCRLCSFRIFHPGSFTSRIPVHSFIFSTPRQGQSSVRDIPLAPLQYLTNLGLLIYKYQFKICLLYTIRTIIKGSCWKDHVLIPKTCYSKGAPHISKDSLKMSSKILEEEADLMRKSHLRVQQWESWGKKIS